MRARPCRWLAPLVALVPLCQAAEPAPNVTGVTVEPMRIIYGHLFEGPFQQPAGLFYDPLQGELFICDAGSKRIAIANAAGVPKFSFGSKETMGSPSRAVVDAFGRIYLADSSHPAIRVFDYDGSPLEEISLEGAPAATRPSRLRSLALTPDGTLYVVDQANRRILVTDISGTAVRALEAPAGRRGVLEAPADVDIAPDGSLVVSDLRGLAIQVFDRNGRFLRGWGDHDTGPPGFSLPAGLAVTPDGLVFIADELRQDIKVFTLEGRFVMRFGGFGSAPGGVRHPVDVESDGADRVFVSERSGRRVQAFRVTVTTER